MYNIWHNGQDCPYVHPLSEKNEIVYIHTYTHSSNHQLRKKKLLVYKQTTTTNLPRRTTSLSSSSARKLRRCSSHFSSIAGTRYVRCIRVNDDWLGKCSFRIFAINSTLLKLFPEHRTAAAIIRSPLCSPLLSSGWEHHLCLICFLGHDCIIKKNI